MTNINRPKVLDTHIHLWPEDSVSPTNHGWMTPGHFLAKRHGISNYKEATSSSPIRPNGFIYVETDRYLPSSEPNIDLSSTPEEVSADTVQALEAWASEPLQELDFLRRIVEGAPREQDGCDRTDQDFMRGCVVWAPFHLPSHIFNTYLQLAEARAQPRLWDKVVGFRFLLQGIKDEKALRDLLASRHWQDNILALRKGRGGSGWTFDVGVDVHGAGVWQVEAVADWIEEMRRGDEGKGHVKFVLNHLCKPDLSTAEPDSQARWLAGMKRLAGFEGVYMKLSGAFNEFAPAQTPGEVDALVERLRFYVRHVSELFGTKRIMFGSDWPVCNVGGPAGDKNWDLWRRVVERCLEEYGKGGEEDVWWRAGCEAYGVEV